MRLVRHAEPMGSRDVAAALADIALLGPFFAVQVGPAPDPHAGWRALTWLYTDPEPLRRRIAEVGRALDTEESRVAASLTFQSLAARIVSPPLALAALHSVALDVDPDRLYWRPAASGPWPLLVPDPVGQPTDDAGHAAAVLGQALIERHLRPLLATVTGLVEVAEPLLWGNAASSVAAALRIVGEHRPTAATAATRLARAVLDTGPLAGTWTGALPAGFRRRSCCLYYRTPGGGLCGDCGLDSVPAPMR